MSDVVKRDFEKASGFMNRSSVRCLNSGTGCATEQAFALPPEDPKGQAFRADDRIIKTLLLAALAPT